MRETRVIDLIAELQGVSSTVPVEVWIKDPGRPYARCSVLGVMQLTPSLLRELDEPDPRPSGPDDAAPGPFPVVIIIERK